jgi:anti-sigma B factor antagonist
MNEKRQILLEFEENGRIHVGTILSSSVLSPANVVEFGREVLEYINRHPGINLLLNFENVDYLSSAVLTELLKVHKAIESTHGRLRLCAVSPVILEVFEITNLNTMFTIHADGVAASIKRFERSLDVAAQEDAWEHRNER